MNKYAAVKQVPPVAALVDRADEVDIKQVDLPAATTLNEMIATSLSYMPWWVKSLYRVRWLFVRLLGMTQEGVPTPPGLQPKDVSLTPGDKVFFFTVQGGQAERYWISGESETHLDFELSVIAEPAPGMTRRFYMVTTVRYNRAIGRIYYFFIRPFHHLLLWSLLADTRRKLTRRSRLKAVSS